MLEVGASVSNSVDGGDGVVKQGTIRSTWRARHPLHRTADVLTEALEVAVEDTRLAAQTRGEIDVRVTTARRFPRSVKRFINEARSLATLNPTVAASCFYKLPRKDKDGRKKTIEGPSARFAENIASTWGHLRCEARPVAQDDRYVTCRGTSWDLETNVAVAFEVQRRIVDAHGSRYSDDMVLQTTNAGCSIAFRNSVFRVVPNSFWEPIYEECKQVAIGDAKALADRRNVMLEFFQQKLNVAPERIHATLRT